MDNLRFSSAPTADSIDASIVQHYPDCEPVAVIGYACHFPESPDGETFWQNLLEGRECSRRFTREELLLSVWMPPSLTILIMSISVRC